KIAKSNPAVAQWLSASLGALVNHGLGKSPITGATESQNATKNNAYGTMKKNTELESWDYYYIIDLYGNVYKRTNTGDYIASPSVVRNGTVTTVVKQNPAEGHQSDGQEVFVYPDGSYVNIDEPLGKVHVGSAHLLTNTSSSWDNPSVNNPAVVEETPRVIDEWPEESTGKIYRVYSNSSEPVFTGEYQGNRNLMSGATAVYNPDHKAWYAGGYVIYQNDEIDAIIRQQQREHEYQIAKDKFNSPNTAIGIMGDAVSYTGEYFGDKKVGNAVTIGQTVPKLIENQDKYDTLGGKFLAGVSDFSNEMAKAELTSTVVTLGTGNVVINTLAPTNVRPTLTKGLILTSVAGFGVNNTIGKYFDEKTKQIKEYIKEEEDEWKNK
ncbi:hypothetical protein, partial [Veillonella sp.]